MHKLGLLEVSQRDDLWQARPLLVFRKDQCVAFKSMLDLLGKPRKDTTFTCSIRTLSTFILSGRRDLPGRSNLLQLKCLAD